MPDSFNGTDHVKFSEWGFKMSNFLSAGDYEYAGNILECITQHEDDVRDRNAARMGWASSRPHDVCEELDHCTEQSFRRDITSSGERRSAQRRGTSASAQGFMKKSLEIPRAKNTSDVSSAIQMLEELVRKYEEHRDKKYGNDLKLHRIYDILPKPIEQQLVLWDRDGSATHGSVKRRKQLDNDEFDRSSRQRWRTRTGLVRRLDGTEGRKGKTRMATVQWILLPVWTVGNAAKNCESTATTCCICGKGGHTAKVVL